MSQKMLADAAGISERTVRNAEKGMVVEVHIASYLSTLFDVPLGDMVLERLEEQRSKWLRKWARKFCLAYETSWNEGTCNDLLQLIHPSVEWSCTTAPKMEFDGRYLGSSAIASWFEMRGCQLKSLNASLRNVKLEKIEGEGEILYIVLSADWVSAQCISQAAWTTFLCRFDDDLAIAVEQFNGLCV